MYTFFSIIDNLQGQGPGGNYGEPILANKSKGKGQLLGLEPGSLGLHPI